jgi:fermentation-respiration switch protein FrsA (DUF1100 family)
MNRWLRLMTKGVGIAALCFIVSSWIVANVLTAPVPSKVIWPTGPAFAPQDVSFQATDGVALKGWFLPGDSSARVVVLLHGVLANRNQMLARALWMHTLGYNVLLYDSRGCGESAPALRSFGCYETRDLLGALRWLQSRGMTEIGCVGCSQGAATILLASEQLPTTVKAIVAEAPYATLRNTTDDHFRAHTGLPSGYFGALVVPMAEWRLGLNMDDVSPLREIPKLKPPLYLIGGTVDTLAPPADIRKLYDAASCDKTLWMVPWAGHSDFFSYAEAEYEQRIGDFLRKHL